MQDSLLPYVGRLHQYTTLLYCLRESRTGEQVHGNVFILYYARIACNPPNDVC